MAPDEGHGFARPVNNMAMLATAEKFLAKHLGGRYQESMTPEVRKRLTEISVDPKTVVLTAAAPDMSAAPAANLSGKWAMTADTGEQKIPISLELLQKSSDFTGSLSSQVGPGTIEKGKVSGANVSATIRADVNGQMMEIQLVGTIQGDSMKGSLAAPGLPPMTFTAMKLK